MTVKSVTETGECGCSDGGPSKSEGLRPHGEPKSAAAVQGLGLPGADAAMRSVTDPQDDADSGDSLDMSIGAPGQAIGIRFTTFQPHAVGGGPPPGYQCVIPSGNVWIAWVATLEYRVAGSFPTGQANNGKLYVEVEILRESKFTKHNRGVNHLHWKATEYYPIDVNGSSAGFPDDHGERKFWQPVSGAGTCKIESRTTMVLRLVVLPMGTGSSFGGPKTNPQTGARLGDKQKGWEQQRLVNQLTAGMYEPPGWKGKKWTAQYEMSPDHCDQLPVVEPPPVKIPTIIPVPSGVNATEHDDRRVASRSSVLGAIAPSLGLLPSVLDGATASSAAPAGTSLPSHSSDGPREEGVSFHIDSPGGGFA